MMIIDPNRFEVAGGSSPAAADTVAPGNDTVELTLTGQYVAPGSIGVVDDE